MKFDLYNNVFDFILFRSFLLFVKWIGKCEFKNGTLIEMNRATEPSIDKKKHTHTMTM